jgi:hypothetical protein
MATGLTRASCRPADDFVPNAIGVQRSSGKKDEHTRIEVVGVIILDDPGGVSGLYSTCMRAASWCFFCCFFLSFFLSCLFFLDCIPFWLLLSNYLSFLSKATSLSFLLLLCNSIDWLRPSSLFYFPILFWLCVIFACVYTCCGE